MPGSDRTGPDGAGPMTGRGRGRCAGFDATERPPERRRGRYGWNGARGGGCGFGRRRRGGAASVMPAAQADLADRVDALERSIAGLQAGLRRNDTGAEC